MNDLANLLRELFLINRSLLGKGYDDSLNKIRQIIPIQKHKFPSGKKIGSWTIPKEWLVKEAFIKDTEGRVVVDYKNNPLHLWQYSKKINKKISLEELKKHISYSKECKGGIPLKVCYYNDSWGFSLKEEQFKKLKKNFYHVKIDSQFQNGNLQIGHLYIPGKSKNEIIIDSVLSCPNLANNLSGAVVSTFLAKYILNRKKNYYSYRFLFTPETIGPLTFGLNEKYDKENFIGGLSLINLADSSKSFNYKLSRSGNTIIDKAFKKLSKRNLDKVYLKKFNVTTGSCGNEKAYNSLGLNLNFGVLSRKRIGSYKEYDTSRDDLSFINNVNLFKSYKFCLKFIEEIEKLTIYKYNFKGEPFLTKFGIKNIFENDEDRLPFDHLMSLCDGENTLEDISKISKIPLNRFQRPLNVLLKVKLLQ